MLKSYANNYVLIEFEVVITTATKLEHSTRRSRHIHRNLLNSAAFEGHRLREESIDPQFFSVLLRRPRLRMFLLERSVHRSE